MAPSAERLIAAALDPPQNRGMDEDTTTCSNCACDGVLRLRQEYLNDRAEWCLLVATVLCEACVWRASLAAWLVVPRDQRVVCTPL